MDFLEFANVGLSLECAEARPIAVQPESNFPAHHQPVLQGANPMQQNVEAVQIKHKAITSPPTQPAMAIKGKSGDTPMDPEAFDIIAKTVFGPAYPVIAEQIIEESGISEGLLLDIGCGGGHLGIAMAKKGGFMVGMMDPAPDMLKIAARNTEEARLSHRIHVVKGSAEDIPLPDESVDLAVSRGSVFFWKDQVAAFKEIHRILKPSAVAYIGGGFGSAAIRDDIVRKMKQRNKDYGTWKQKMSERLGPDAIPRFTRALEESGIPNFKVSHDSGKGLWIIIRKGERP